ncbi:MAG: glycosyltransferase, partial [Bryocella sp.]
YPTEQLEIIIVSDGSTDRTAAVLNEYRDFVVPLILPQRNGKANALNQAALAARGEILVFLDVRQTVDQNALLELCSCFADANVGAVSGELILTAPAGQQGGEGVGIYWKIEKMVRKLESRTGSVVGATGAIYAIRRSLFEPIPSGTLLDDVLIPMNIARKGSRVVFQPTATAHDQIFAESGKEFSRKVRTLTGNYQLLVLAPWLLTVKNPLLFRFVSHKLLRLIVPYCLIALILSSAIIRGPFYRVALLLQLLFYGLAMIGMSTFLRRWRPAGIAYTFVTLNLAAVVACRNFLSRQNNVWN